MKKTKPQYRGLIGAGLVMAVALTGGGLLIQKYFTDDSGEGGNSLAPLAKMFGLSTKDYAPAPITSPIPDYRSAPAASSNSEGEGVSNPLAGFNLGDLIKTKQEIRRGAAESVGSIIGVASVIDGDTLDIGGQRIRLYGIDAPESRQTCLHSTGEWDCGNRAGLWLQQYLAGNEVSCLPQGNDRYGRVVATCMVGENDIGGEMVKAGWAVAYRSITKTYVIAETDAKRKRFGLWDSKFTMPWEFRQEQ